MQSEKFLEKFVCLCDAHLQQMKDFKGHFKCRPTDWKIFNDKLKNATFAMKAFDNECKRASDHCHICGQFRGAAHMKCNQLTIG